jgi:hypothetical protein
MDLLKFVTSWSATIVVLAFTTVISYIFIMFMWHHRVGLGTMLVAGFVLAILLVIDSYINPEDK